MAFYDIPKTDRNQLLIPSVLAVSFGTIFLFLLFRNLGLYPFVFADEWTYSVSSRLKTLSDANIPSYLFLFLYRCTNYFGDSFLEGARILNTIFFTLSLPFIYFVCRLVASRNISSFVAVISLLLPVNIYTAYFMPESMYFFCFWVFSWFALTFFDKEIVYYAAISGFLLGVMALIKVHAIFIIPGFVFFVFFCRVLSLAHSKFIEFLKFVVVFGCSFCLVRLSMGYLLAGWAGLDLIGGLYGSYAKAAIDFDHLFKSALLAMRSFIGHIMALGILFSLSMCFLVDSSGYKKSEKALNPRFHLLQVYTLFILMPLLVVVAYFTATVAGSGPYETVSRLHMRYYDFIFPMLIIVVASKIENIKSKLAVPKALYGLVFIFIANFTYAFATKFNSYTLNVVDSPVLHGVISRHNSLIIFSVFGIFCLLLMFLDIGLASSVYFYLFIPLFTIVSLYNGSKELRHNLKPTTYDVAGQFAKSLLGDDYPELVVIGSEPAGLYRVLFHLDSSKDSLIVVPQNASIDKNIIPSEKSWALIIGDHPVDFIAPYKITMPNFSLLKLSTNDLIELNKNKWPGIVTTISGLSYSESWGRWSVSDEVIFELTHPLPKTCKIKLVANAFGPNIDKPFSLVVGHNIQTFTLSTTLKEVSLIFDTDGNTQSFKIFVPDPKSPMDIGLSPDTRRLGIGLEKVFIEAI